MSAHSCSHTTLPEPTALALAALGSIGALVRRRASPPV